MTLRIERVPNAKTTTLRLIGQIRADHLDELTAQTDGSRAPVILDLEEVNLVDVEVVRFLGKSLDNGIRLGVRATRNPKAATQNNRQGETI